MDPHWIRFQCAASSAPSFASGGGGSDGIDGNGGGGGEGDGDGAAEGGEGKSTAVAAGAEDDSALSSDVIVLHVGVSSYYYYIFFFQSHFIWRKWEEYFLYFLFKRPSQEIMKYPLIVKLLKFISLHVMV